MSARGQSDLSVIVQHPESEAGPASEPQPRSLTTRLCCTPSDKKEKQEDVSDILYSCVFLCMPKVSGFLDGFLWTGICIRVKYN